MLNNRDQYRDRCIHFNGVQHAECRAEVNYDRVRRPGLKLPCIRHDGLSGAGCDKRRWPTEEEVEQMAKADEVATETMLAGFIAVAEDALQRKLGRGAGGCGEVRCPVCPYGTIHYQVSGYNGHRHAKCTTDGCVNFIE